MIYYFSGTGNSKLVAIQLAERLNEKYCNILNPLLCKEEILGLVFPVYAWGMPYIVRQFIEETLHKLANANIRYIYVVMTCGDDIGYTDVLVANSLKKTGLAMNAAFSILMPNTYVCLPGFDIDCQNIAKSKIDKMYKHLPEIVEKIESRKNTIEVKRGTCAFIKTYLIRPLFNQFLITDYYFHIDNTQCNRCGKCVRTCPVNNIVLTEEKVSWTGSCTGCLGCYHSCPQNAIQYGLFTKGKGQKK